MSVGNIAISTRCTCRTNFRPVKPSATCSTCVGEDVASASDVLPGVRDVDDPVVTSSLCPHAEVVFTSRVHVRHYLPLHI